MSTTTTATTLRPDRLASSPKRLIRRLRHEERGVLDIELIGFVPILVLVTMFLVQGFLAVSTVTSVSAAARDGARAAMLGRPPSRPHMRRYPTGCAWNQCRMVAVPGTVSRSPLGCRSVSQPSPLSTSP